MADLPTTGYGWLRHILKLGAPAHLCDMFRLRYGVPVRTSHCIRVKSKQ